MCAVNHFPLEVTRDDYFHSPPAGPAHTIKTTAKDTAALRKKVLPPGTEPPLQPPSLPSETEVREPGTKAIPVLDRPRRGEGTEAAVLKGKAPENVLLGSGQRWPRIGQVAGRTLDERQTPDTTFPLLP